MRSVTEEIIVKVTCLRCGHQWFPYHPGTPIRCARCKTPYWNTPYSRKKKEAPQ